MSKNANFVSHKKSKQIVDGKPKLPLASDLVEGEIAINFGKDVETLSIKNESGDVVTFSSDNYYTEKKLGSGFTGEKSGVTVTEAIENSEEVSISSGVTPSGTGIEIWIDESEDPAEADVYTKEQTDSLLNLKLDTSAYTEYWTSGTSENAVVLKNSSGTASGSYAVAEGYKTSATSNYSHAEGNSTQASGQSSHAEGSYTKANGNYSHAEGSSTKAIGNYSHTEGNSTQAIGTDSHAEGASTTASGQSSHAEGNYTEANGNYSHAEGQDSKANGDYSHAEGSGTLANGMYSHSEGSNTQAYGQQSHAEGGATVASNWAAHAEGQDTLALGQRSHAEGGHTRAQGSDSHAEGFHTVANNQSEHASGQYNVSSSASTEFGNGGNTLFSVGNGTAENARHNAFEIRQNGDIYIVNKNGQDVKLQDEIGNITVDQVLDDTTSASTNPVSSKAVYKAVTDNELVWTNAFVALSGTVSAHTENTEIHVTAADKEKLHTHANKASLDSITGNVGTMAYEDKASYSSATEVNTALGNKANTSDLASYADSVKYNSTSHYVEFYHGTTAGTKVFEYDASPFIIDGMVQNVEIKDVTSGGSQVTCLVISFNTDAGKQDINVPISDIFDANNYYDKTAIDNLVGSGFTSSSITNVIIENEEIVSAALTDLDERKLDASAYTPTDLSNYYTKSETSGATELQTAFNGKTDTATTTTLNNVVTAHTASTTIHVTQADKDKWNNAGGGFVEVTNPTASTKVGLVNKLSQYYDTKIGKGAVIEGDGSNDYNKISASGDYSHAEGHVTSASGSYSHAEGQNTIASGSSSHAEGNGTTASGSYSHAEGQNTIASGSYGSHAEGYGTTASGNRSHAEGQNTIASGSSSHAEGVSTTASGYASHAEGSNTIASGSSSHAEGSSTKAIGNASHAEGQNTIASGYASHAEGFHTIANNQSEHASGQYNVSSSASTTFGDGGNTLFSVGNGTSDSARHNAFEIRQNGDIYIVNSGSTVKLQDLIGDIETLLAAI